VFSLAFYGKECAFRGAGAPCHLAQSHCGPSCLIIKI
jgi:hypothetical protein